MEDAIKMPRKQFDIYETEALQAGGVAACQYLDTLGTTDMAELSQEQWLLFFTKYAVGYASAMKTVFEGMAK